MTRTLMTPAILLAMVAAGCGGTRTEEPTTTKSGGAASSAPSGEAAARRDKALTRFVHAHPGAPVMDLYFGEVKMNPGVRYKGVTPYQEVPGERAEFRLRATNETQGPPLATNSEALSDGQHYTIVTLPLDNGGPTLRAIRDDLAAPDAGKAKVRVIHAAANVGEVDVFTAGRKLELFDGVDYNEATGYKQVDPLQGTLEVRKEDAANQGGVVLRVPNVNLQAGGLYTLIVARAKPDGPLEAFQIEDRIGAAR